MLGSYRMQPLATEYLTASPCFLLLSSPASEWLLENHKSWLASTSSNFSGQFFKVINPSLTRSNGYAASSKVLIDLKCFLRSRTEFSFDCVSNILATIVQQFLEAFHSMMPNAVMIGSGFNFNMLFIWAFQLCTLYMDILYRIPNNCHLKRSAGEVLPINEFSRSLCRSKELWRWPVPRLAQTQQSSGYSIQNEGCYLWSQISL